MKNKMFFGDCLEIMPDIPEGSIDAIITDIPYGTTACAWDEIIPLNEMWNNSKRVLKQNGVFITTSAQPFTSKLIMSNLKWFLQAAIWDKVFPVGFLDAKKKLLRVHEDIVIFSPRKSITYNPIMEIRGKPRSKGGAIRKNDSVYHDYKPQKSFNNEYYPKTIVQFSNANRNKKHPTQKPVELYEWLVRTYTNPGETVLDIACGSGTTGEACIKTGRNFIGIEKEKEYYQISIDRLERAENNFQYSILL